MGEVFFLAQLLLGIRPAPLGVALKRVLRIKREWVDLWRLLAACPLSMRADHDEHAYPVKAKQTARGYDRLFTQLHHKNPQ
jgi:hypothetical protein